MKPWRTRFRIAPCPYRNAAARLSDLRTWTRGREPGAPYFAAPTVTLPVAVRPNRAGRYMSSTVAPGCT